MTVHFIGVKDFFNDEQVEALKSFTELLQREVPLKRDVKANFVGERIGPMTTGSRVAQHILNILSKDRLLIDVMRTYAHEWIHEFEHQKLGVKDQENLKPESPEEALCNIVAGIMTKKFDHEYPQFSHLIYGEKNFDI